MTSKGFLVDANGQVLKATAKALDIVTGVDGLAALSAAQLVAKESMATAVSVVTFGAVLDGVTDDSAAINAAITATAAAGQILTIPQGKTAACASPIVLKANTKIRANGATFKRLCGTTGSGGFIGGDPLVKTSNVSIEGLTVLGIDTTTYSGNVFAIYGDDCDLTNCTVDTYGGSAGGRAVFIRGDRNTIMRLKGKNCRQAPGVGGIRMAGGTRFRAMLCDVESGDDTYQFVPGASDNQSISDAMYLGCTGGSYTARLIVVALVDPVSGNTTASYTQPAVGSTVLVSKTSDNRYQVGDTVYVDTGGYYTCTVVNSNLQLTLRNDGALGNATAGTVIASGSRVLRGDEAGDTGGAMTATINDVSFVGVKGFARGASSNVVTIRNSDSTGGIDGVTITDCAVDCTGTTGLYQVYVEGNLVGAYPTSNISIKSLRLRGVYGVPLRAVASDTYGAIKGLQVFDFQADKQSTTGPGAQIFGVTGGSITASSLYANGDNGILLGATGKTTNNFTVDRNTIRDIADASSGVQLAVTAACRVTSNKFYKAAGTTTSRGVGVGTTNTTPLILGNDYADVPVTVTSTTSDEGTSYPNFGVGNAPGSAAVSFNIAPFRNADGNSILNLYAQSDGTVSAKIQRTGGANSALVLQQNGTGAFQVNMNGTVKFTVANGGACTIASGGLNVTAGGITVTAGSITTPLGNYANDAAAAAGSVPVNGLYRTGNAVQQRLV